MTKQELAERLSFILECTCDIHEDIRETLEKKHKKYLAETESDLTYVMQILDDIITNIKA